MNVIGSSSCSNRSGLHSSFSNPRHHGAPPESDPERQRHWFRETARLQRSLQVPGTTLDTLSMGMSDDLEMAILEGATIVRVGTALFGPRPR